MNVLIIGAGATGLFIAQGLQKNGISCRVFERDSLSDTKRRPRDWSMGLHWAREYFEEMLQPDILKDIHTINTDPWSETLPQSRYKYAVTPDQMKAFTFVNGKTGQKILDVPIQTSSRASRRKARELFSRGIDVEYDKKLKAVDFGEDKVSVEFEDGEIAVGDILIGADGVNSRTRSYLLAPEDNQLEALPTIMYNFCQKYTAEQACFLRDQWHPNFKYAMHPDLNVAMTFAILDVPDPDDPAGWTFQFLVDQWGRNEHLPTSEERCLDMKRLTSQFCEPFKSAGQWVKEDTYFFADIIRHMPNLKPWNTKGHATLAGDAAHPMAPYRAQGLNSGLKDGYHLVQAIKSAVRGEKSLKAALDDYTAEVAKRGLEEIHRSADQGKASHHYDLLLKSKIFTLGMNKAE